MEFYSGGRKFINDEPVEGITVIGEEKPIEVVIQGNAPEPFVYGVKNICTSITNIDNTSLCTIYNVLTGEYLENQEFKGYEWLNTMPPLIFTAPIEEDPIDIISEISTLKQLTAEI